MTFDEFFKKKRIDVAALQSGEASLFLEFKTHFEQMGEKSFDHTKKYWFNKLRRQYPLLVEVKTEKFKIENPLAEQTVTEVLIEEVAPKPVAPKLGFAPKFKAANIPRVAEDTKPINDTPVTQPEANPVPKLGFKPKFKAAGITKPVLEEKSILTEPVKDNPSVPPAENEAPKPYKPRFNMKNVPRKEKEE